MFSTASVRNPAAFAHAPRARAVLAKAQDGKSVGATAPPAMKPEGSTGASAPAPDPESPAGQSVLNKADSQPASGAPKDTTDVKLDVPEKPVETQLFSRTQELINGRAAMVGIIVAAISEVLSNQSVVTQMTGKVANGEVVERAHGQSFFYYGAIITVLTLASLAPRLFEGEQPEDRQWGPFQAGAELVNGRAAMVGFLALVLFEGLTGGKVF